MNIALAQIAPKLGDVEANFALHAEVLEKARRKKAGLVVFPELGLTGYTLKDLVEEVAFDPRTDRRFARPIRPRSAAATVCCRRESRPGSNSTSRP